MLYKIAFYLAALVVFAVGTGGDAPPFLPWLYYPLHFGLWASFIYEVVINFLELLSPVGQPK